MSKVICERGDIVAIADAVRNKTNNNNDMTLGEIVEEINGIEGGADYSVEDSLITKTVTNYTNDRTQKIGMYAFAYCSSLTSVSFPVCTSIGSNAFYSCTSLTSVSFPVCTSIANHAFYTCRSLTSVDFPVCKTINGSAFYSCSSLTSVDFPACTIINGGAFYSCTSLTSVSFPVCTSIGSSAFYSCRSLTSVSFPVCKTINGGAFANCSSLTSISLDYSSVVTLKASTAFNVTPMKNSTYTGDFGSIYVPSSLVEAYKKATNWTYFADRITAIVE